MPILALVSLAVTTVAIVVVLLAAGRTARQVRPTTRSIDQLRRELAPALVVVRTDRQRAHDARVAASVPSSDLSQRF